MQVRKYKLILPELEGACVHVHEHTCIIREWLLRSQKSVLKMVYKIIRACFFFPESAVFLSLKKKKGVSPSFHWGWGREGSSLFSELNGAAFVF